MSQAPDLHADFAGTTPAELNADMCPLTARSARLILGTDRVINRIVAGAVVMLGLVLIAHAVARWVLP